MTSKRRILIHIGPPKTGSTYLQSLLHNNKDELNKNSIEFLQYKLKVYLRHFHKERMRENNRILTKIGFRKNVNEIVTPWFKNIPTHLFREKSPHHSAIYSEEALSKIIYNPFQVKLFDELLDEQFSDRIYLAVLREINAHCTSMVSQEISGIRRFSYQDCARMLNNYSLNRNFRGILENDLNLKLETFNRLVSSPQATQNVNTFLKTHLDQNSLNLKALALRKNESQGAEGTAVLLAFNNILRLLLTRKKLLAHKVKIVKTRKVLETEIFKLIPSQKKFLPFNRKEQEKFNQVQVLRSQKLIKRYPGEWIDEVFTPSISDKSISLIAQFDPQLQNAVKDLLMSSIWNCLNELPSTKTTSEKEVEDVINYFFKNEVELVKGRDS